MANEAIEVVTTYMLSKRFESPDERAEYVNWALSEKDNWPFRYERVVETEDSAIVSGSQRHRILTKLGK